MTFQPVNVADHLARLAAAEPTRPAIHFPTRGVRIDGPSDYLTYSFAELNAWADALAHGLKSIGIDRGTRTALMVPPSPEFFALTFALLKLAAVPVLIDPGMGIKNLGTCLAEAEPEAFIGIPKAHLARRLFGWAKKSLRTTVNVGHWRFFCDLSLRGLRDLGSSHGPFNSPTVTADDPSAILFTSGSTGIAKGVEYTHGIFAAQVELLKQTYGIEPGEVDLCTFPLFALFGPALGMTCVIPDMNPSQPATLDPRKALAQVKQFQVTNLFGSPAVVRRLGELTEPLATVRRVISAGAPASPAALERLTKLLPSNAEIFTPYGATEALPVANIGSREILAETRHLTDRGKGVCVGRLVAGIRVVVVPITDDAIAVWNELLVLPPGQIGEFVVRGPVVTKQYFHRPEATRLAKIHDPTTGEVLHRMGDVGYIDDLGRLWFCGRKSHRVETPKGTLFTDQVEPIFNRSLQRGRTALIGVRRNGVTYPVVCVEFGGWLYRDMNLKVRISWPGIETELLKTAKLYDTTQSIGEFLPFTSPFPVDVRHNSKIFREKLAVWADKKLGSKWNPQAKTQGQPSLGLGGP